VIETKTKKKLYFTKNACHKPVCSATKILAIYNQKRIARVLPACTSGLVRAINFVLPGPHNWADVFHVIGFFAV